MVAGLGMPLIRPSNPDRGFARSLSRKRVLVELEEDRRHLTEDCSPGDDGRRPCIDSWTGAEHLTDLGRLALWTGAQPILIDRYDD